MVFEKGHIPWNKGKSELYIGENNSFYGKHHTEKTKKKVSEKNSRRTGGNHPLYGKPKTEGHKRKISETKKQLFNEGKLECWREGLTKDTDNRILNSSLKQSMTRKKLIKDGKIKVIGHGITIKTDGKNNGFYGKHHTKETKEKLSSIKKIKKTYNQCKSCGCFKSPKKQHVCINYWQNPEWKKKTIEAQLKGLFKRPTSLENPIINLIGKYTLPYKYVGDGSFLIGWKNPDFINTNAEKICIEVANRFHHQGDWAEKRIEHYAKYGWKCTILWWEEIFSDKYGKKFTANWEQNILKKIGDYDVRR